MSCQCSACKNPNKKLPHPVEYCNCAICKDKKVHDYYPWIKLLENVCQGLKSQGFIEHGENDVFRTLSKGENELCQSVKVYLNNYTNPSHIVVRYS